MGKRRVFSEEEKNYIIKEYLENGKSVKNICSEVNAGIRTIRNFLTEQGIHLRNIQETNSKDFSDDVKDKIIYNYVNLQMGLIPSGKPFGATEYMVKKILKERGVKIRTYVESKDLLRKYSINDEYFKTQSHNMAYILGFLASDGNVSKKENNITLSLHQKDAQIIEEISKELSSTYPISYYTTSEGHEKVTFRCHSSTIKKDLAHYNIIPDKTFILSPPDFLTKEYRISYIRGMFDGDGSIYECNNTIGWTICGASKEVLEWIRSELANQYGITNNGLYMDKNRCSEGRNFYRLTYYGDKVKEIFKILYPENFLKLNRKYERMKELCEIKSKRLH